MILGLHGHAQVGKDTFAAILVDHYGFERLAFADVLRDAVRLLDPWLIGYDEKPVRLSTLLTRYTWDELKKHEPYREEIRRLLQVLGSEVGRDLLYAGIWVDTLTKKLNFGKKYVVTDVRFKNEAWALRSTRIKPVWLVKITRPGYGPVNAHVSDVGLPDSLFDAFVINDGDLDELRAEAEGLLTRMGVVNAAL
jgi:hypothetical protein